MPKIHGGCLCGAVRYQSDAEPVVTAICQCTHCQKQSGSAFAVNIGVPKGTLRYTGEIPALYRDSGESGQAVDRRFCARCGSPVVSEVQATPKLDWVKAGTLDDTTWVKPQAAGWCRSAQAWVSLAADITQFPTTRPPA